MDELFLKIFNMSVAANWLILTVILLRLPLKKISGRLSCILWAIAAIRLICPYSLKSIFSFIPSETFLPYEALYNMRPEIQSGIDAVDRAINPTFSQSFAADPFSSVNPLQIAVALGSVIWIAGILAMLLYSVTSIIRLRLITSEGLEQDMGFWMCDRISSPFIMGVFKPKIFLPSFVKQSDIPYVMAHERSHIKHLDHIWKPLGWCLLTVYWFDPLVWIAYILFSRDMELACDERVIFELGAGSKKPYAKALINCSERSRMISAYPLAFGEVGVRSRLKAVMSCKKPKVWTVVIASAICAVTAVCFLTYPKLDRYEGMWMKNATRYTYADSVDTMQPEIYLSGYKSKFRFTYSAFSSYIAEGHYTLTNEELVLTTDDALGYVYVFRRDGADLIFDAERSQSIPMYAYALGVEPQSPVPDGARFTRVSDISFK